MPNRSYEARKNKKKRTIFLLLFVLSNFLLPVQRYLNSIEMRWKCTIQAGELPQNRTEIKDLFRICSEAISQKKRRRA